MRIIRTFQDFFQEDPCLKITDCLSCLKSGCYLVDFWGDGIEKCVDFITLTSGWSRDGWFSYIGIGDEVMCPVRYQWVATPPDTVVTSVTESNLLLLKISNMFLFIIATALVVLNLNLVQQMRKDFWPSEKKPRVHPAPEPVMMAAVAQREEVAVEPEVEAANDGDEWDPWEENVWRHMILVYELPRQRG